MNNPKVAIAAGRSLGLLVLAGLSVGCPSQGTGTRPTPPSTSTELNVSLIPGSVMVAPGSSASFRIVVFKGNPNAAVQLDLEPLGNGMTGTISPSRLDPSVSEATLTIATAVDTPIAIHDVRVVGRLVVGGAFAPTSTTASAELQVGAPLSGFNLVCDAEITIRPGVATTFVCRVNRQAGFVAPVELTFEPFPEYLVVTPGRATVGAADFGATFLASIGPARPPANYTLTATGRAGSEVRQSTVRIRFATE